MQSPFSILQKYWHFQHFRPLQEEIINHVIAQKDTFAILPTGAGKSICYQIPALLADGVCLVITPLISLMKDQVLGLKKRGITAYSVYSGMSREEIEAIYIKVKNKEVKFLFLSPERLKSNLLLDYLNDWKVCLIVIDEAHCISQWGYDFRPSYLQIADFCKEIPTVPKLALTASATSFVQKDIIEKLDLKNQKIFFSTFKRENISISVFNVESKIVKLIDILKKVKGSKIVYCNNRKRTVEIAEILNNSGFKADYFHAGLDQKIKDNNQDKWIHNQTEIIVCTNAFGMGIDKPDVRCVIHFDTTDSPEAYYQEIGRAGRDGKKSFAVILYTIKDIETLQNSIELKYPTIETIKEVYQSLAYYFQIPVGSGNEEVFDFEINDFCKKFNHNIITSYNSIKILEQQSLLLLIENIFLPSTIKFTTTKSDLQFYEKNIPALDEIIKLLLRLYGGIWNHDVHIDEFLLAQKASVSLDYIQHILQQLHDKKIIFYKKRKYKPQITYLHNRIDKQKLTINTQLLTTLKLRYTARVHFMKNFIAKQTSCRSKSIINYFGEKNNDHCGICDVCISYKKNINKDDFNTIKNTILQTIANQKSLNISTYCTKLNSIEIDKTMKIIHHLLDEKSLILNQTGDLTTAT